MTTWTLLDIKKIPSMQHWSFSHQQNLFLTQIDPCQYLSLHKNIILGPKPDLRETWHLRSLECVKTYASQNLATKSKTAIVVRMAEVNRTRVEKSSICEYLRFRLGAANILCRLSRRLARTFPRFILILEAFFISFLPFYASFRSLRASGPSLVSPFRGAYPYFASLCSFGFQGHPHSYPRKWRSIRRA